VTVRLPDRNASRALLIGASRFTMAGLHDLPAVANNARALADVLTDSDIGILDRAGCRLLADPATPQEVGYAIDAVVSEATDTLVLYYAGHGILNQRGVLYLAVASTKSDPLRVCYGGVPMEWLRSALADSAADNRILILDCCFSGHAAEALSAAPSAVIAELDIRGTYTLASAPAHSSAVAPVGERFTAFTGELLEVLRQGIRGGGPLLSLVDIYPTLTRALLARGMPRPQHLGTGLADRVALARNVAYGAETSLIGEQSALPERRIERTSLPIPRTVREADAKVAAEFHTAMLDVYRKAKKETGYNASYFLRLVEEVGGLEAARRLLHAGSVSSGFSALWEKGRLDLSVEAVVLQGRFADLFTDEELTVARDRLAEYGYHPLQTS